ncbi:hypothetical protein [Kineococcus indalonis]|uniref:hypothetical protein n=1 Tax=Kineococcus indalonis TaxID=2696566 RepID=UPI001411B2E4|nr:hypothetical protein [Kineococcus indalonis]NAZ84573.1 hypothetical protein [Kineococcus indalonis]
MKLSAVRLSRFRQRNTTPGAKLTSAQAKAVERECLDVLAQLRPRPPFDKDTFLSHIAYLAGGPIYTGVLPDGWADLLVSRHGGHTSAITLSQYDGWAIYVNARAGVPDVLNYGHEAGHVLFDAPRGDGAPPDEEVLHLPPAGSAEAERLLTASWSRRGGFAGLPESRAERFGTLLKAGLEGLGAQPHEQDGSLSSLFRAGDV